MYRKEKTEVNALAAASLIFGILAILSSWIVIPGIMNALLALMFASLSKGCRKKCGVAAAGMILAFSAVVISIIAAAVFVGVAANYINNISGSPEEMLRNFFDTLGNPQGV